MAEVSFVTPPAKRARTEEPVEFIPITGGSAYPEAFVALWRDDKFCDIKVELDDGALISASRQVLAAGSEFFATALEQQHFAQGAMHCIREMHTSCFTACLEFLYTGEATIVPDLVVELLEAATRLRVNQLMEAVARAIHKSTLRAKNAVALWSIAERYESPVLAKAARRMCMHHFEIIATHPTLLDLSADHLKALLQDDALQVSCESTASDALLRWAEHCRPSATELANLFASINVSHLSTQYLRTLRQHELVATSIGVLGALSDALITARENADAKAPRHGQSGLVYVIGGQHQRPGVGLAGTPPCIFDAEMGTFTPLPPMPTVDGHEVWQARAAFVSGHLYVLGGYFEYDLQRSNRVHRYDASEDSWHAVASMPTARSNFDVAVLDGKLYAAGGAGDGVYNLVERYDPKTDAWEMLAPMSICRQYFALVAFRGKLYAIGGSEYSSAECSMLESVERYDPESNTWTGVASLHCPRNGIAAVVYDDQIYVIGGAMDEDQCLPVSVEIFVDDDWVMSPNPLPAGRDGVTAAVIPGVDGIFVFGGSTTSTDHDAVSTVLKWDYNSGWTEVALRKGFGMEPQWLASCCAA